MIEAIGIVLTHYISTLGYPAIFVLMAAESALVPIPSEVTMPFSGFLAAQGYLIFWEVILVGALGNLVGSLIAYAIGYWGSEAGVRLVIKKYGKWLLVTVSDYDRAVGWFRKFGSQISFFSRMLPIVRTFVSLPAGVSRMNIFVFSFYTLLGSIIWSLVLALAGYKLGERWSVLGGYFRKFDVVIGAVIAIMVFFYLYHKIRKVRRELSEEG